MSLLFFKMAGFLRKYWLPIACVALVSAAYVSGYKNAADAYKARIASMQADDARRDAEAMKARHDAYSAAVERANQQAIKYQQQATALAAQNAQLATEAGNIKYVIKNVSDCESSGINLDFAAVGGMYNALGVRTAAEN